MDELQTTDTTADTSADTSADIGVVSAAAVDASIPADIRLEVVGFDAAKLTNTSVAEISATVEGMPDVAFTPDAAEVSVDPMIGTAF